MKRVKKKSGYSTSSNNSGTGITVMDFMERFNTPNVIYVKNKDGTFTKKKLKFKSDSNGERRYGRKKSKFKRKSKK